MNIAIIFAGGVGSRMNSRALPKQFLELHNKPIIVYTLELFASHPSIDGIIVSCVEGWIDHLRELLVKFSVAKVVDVVPGGSTGQLSIYNALAAAEKSFPATSVVLIHDGVRPLINHQVISDNIEQVRKTGSAVTVAPAIETFVVIDQGAAAVRVPDRASSKLAKAPQSFILAEILEVHRQAMQDNINDAIDSCTLMHRYNKRLSFLEGPTDNIKITTPTDYFLFRAILEARENRQILGV